MIKVGILTYHRSCNYGAHLQALSLCLRLNDEEDINAEIIDFRMKVEEYYNSEEWWSIRRKIVKFPSYNFHKKLYRAFERAFDNNKMRLSPEHIVSNNISDFVNLVKDKYDVIIAGSDEIWKTDSSRGFPNPYWLIGDLGCRKFSYAASSRSDLSLLSDEQKEIIEIAINDFEYISVRDELTFKEILPYVKDKDKMFLSCDPSFLYNFNPKNDFFSKIYLDRNHLSKDKKNIVIMLEDGKIARSIKSNLRNCYNLISVYEWHFGYANDSNLNPLEWLDLIASADLVITSFYHGICFSITNNVPFIAIGTKSKKSKLRFVTKYSETQDRYIEFKEDINYDWNKIVRDNMKLIDCRKIVDDQKSGFETFLKVLKGKK